MGLSTFLERFEEPATLKMAQMARDLAASGVDVISLSVGEPDFDTPDHIKLAAIDAINQNYSHYTPVAGYLETRKAACVKLKRDNNLDYSPEHIVFSSGAKQSLMNAIFAIVDAGDEVIIPTPYWVTYSELVKMAGGVVVELKTKVEDGFKISAEALANAITPKTKVFLFSSPCNPSGAVYSKEELANMVEIFEQNPSIYIISDEIYEYINYVGAHASFAHFSSIKDRVVLVNGLSKGFAMTGWRVGYTASSKEIAAAMTKIQGQTTSATNAIAQRAAIAALENDITPSLKMTSDFKERRDMVLEFIKSIPGLKCNTPEGAFYVFPDVTNFFGKTDGSVIINNAADLSLYLLNKAHVSTVAGGSFGDPNCVRFAYATSSDKLKLAWSRIKDALAVLK